MKVRISPIIQTGLRRTVELCFTLEKVPDCKNEQTPAINIQNVSLRQTVQFYKVKNKPRFHLKVLMTVLNVLTALLQTEKKIKWRWFYSQLM